MDQTLSTEPQDQICLKFPTPSHSPVRSVTHSRPKVCGINNIDDYIERYEQIENAYMGVMNYHSITLDLVSLYLKGQKLLYTESKTYCEVMLYTLMLPTILISSLCTVLNVPLKEVSYGNIVVSALNGFNSFLLALVTYLKLDAKAEAHKTSAYQFDKLQTMCEFYSGKTVMIYNADAAKQVSEFIDSLEKKVAEVKDANQFIIPESIRHRYNDIYSYNVFVIMKEYKTTRMLNIQKLIDVNNEIRKRQVVSNNDETTVNMELEISSFPSSEINQKSFINIFRKKEEINLEKRYRSMNIYSKQTSLIDLYTIRDICIRDIIKYRNISSDLNVAFNDQVENYITESHKWYWSIFKPNLFKT